ncbi:MAG TPA: hypothetical protein VL424_08735, partial [Pararobbsia sp.]|nr:hypothetical protein [Pararobbsia sp.]
MKRSWSNAEVRKSRAESLPQLYIPDASPIPSTQPDSALYGVGIADTLNGLVVVVPAYEDMAPGDDVRVYWDTSIA